MVFPWECEIHSLTKIGRKKSEIFFNVPQKWVFQKSSYLSPGCRGILMRLLHLPHSDSPYQASAGQMGKDSALAYMRKASRDAQFVQRCFHFACGSLRGGASLHMPRIRSETTPITPKMLKALIEEVNHAPNPPGCQLPAAHRHDSTR